MESHPTTDARIYDLPQSLAPTARLTGKQFFGLLLLMCLLPLAGLTCYAVFFGRAHDTPLKVDVGISKEPIPTADGSGALMTDVVWIKSLYDEDLLNVTIDLNGQYFLYRQSPLHAGERLVLPQQIFSTKSNQRFRPGRYPITEINVTGKLPSGRRAVKTATFAEDRPANEQ